MRYLAGVRAASSASWLAGCMSAAGWDAVGLSPSGQQTIAAAAEVACLQTLHLAVPWKLLCMRFMSQYARSHWQLAGQAVARDDAYKCAALMVVVDRELPHHAALLA